MAAQFLIRSFQADDAERLVALWQSVLPSSRPWNDPSDVLFRKTASGDDLIFVAEQNAAVVGAVIAGYDGVRGWIYQLAVSEECRRKGIGRALMEYAEAKLLSLGCPKVNLQVREDNLPVIDFYERCGFSREDRASLGKQLLPATEPSGDPVPTITVSDQFSLSPITWDDKPAYLEYLNQTAEFYANGVETPFPYTEADADRWISFTQIETLARDCRRSWAIRDEGQQLVGGIGLSEIKQADKANVGYWLAKPLWGRGIVTSAVRTVCSFAFREYALRKIYARAYATNPASARVLSKAGFKHEGTLRQEFVRNGTTVDDLMFGLLADELT